MSTYRQKAQTSPVVGALHRSQCWRSPAADADCPAGSECVVHDDGTNYCFLVCADKVECNRNRSADNEANCSGSVTYVEADNEGKACLPPSGN